VQKKAPQQQRLPRKQQQKKRKQKNSRLIQRVVLLPHRQSWWLHLPQIFKSRLFQLLAALETEAVEEGQPPRRICAMAVQAIQAALTAVPGVAPAVDAEMGEAMDAVRKGEIAVVVPVDASWTNTSSRGIRGGPWTMNLVGVPVEDRARRKQQRLN